MKAKYIDKRTIKLLNVEEERIRLNKVFEDFCYNNGYSEALMERIKSVPEEERTEEDAYHLKMYLTTKEDIDGEIADLVNYKEFVSCDKSSLEEFYDYYYEYSETDTQVIQSLKIVGISNFEVKERIKELKKELTDSDYKIIKLYEASLFGEDSEYDKTEVIQKRQELRDEINRLEQLLN